MSLVNLPTCESFTSNSNACNKLVLITAGVEEVPNYIEFESVHRIVHNRSQRRNVNLTGISMVEMPV